MMNNDNVLYKILEDKVNIIAESFDINVPYHKFSRKYMRKEKRMLKSYIKAKEEKCSIDQAYHKLSLGSAIKYVAIMIVLILLLTGFTIYITHYIGNMQLNEYGTHSFAFSTDNGSYPETIETQYVITYNLSDWEKQILNDNSVLYSEIYIKQNMYVDFEYFVKEVYPDMRFNTENSVIESHKIGEKDAIYFVSPDGTNCLLWDNGDYIFQFAFVGITMEEATAIIDSIEANPK